VRYCPVGVGERYYLVGLGFKDFPVWFWVQGIVWLVLTTLLPCRFWLQGITWKVLTVRFSLVVLVWKVFHGRSWLEGIAK